MGKIIRLVIIALPLIEIAGFVLVGRILGVAGTLMLVVLSAMLGLAIVRRQGFSTLIRLQEAVNSRQTPVQPLFEGFCLALAGVLFILPGFFTDLIALALLVPALRRILFRFVGRNVTVHGGDGPNSGSGPGNETPVIDGEFHEIGDDLQSPPESRWRPPESRFQP